MCILSTWTINDSFKCGVWMFCLWCYSIVDYMTMNWANCVCVYWCQGHSLLQHWPNVCHHGDMETGPGQQWVHSPDNGGLTWWHTYLIQPLKDSWEHEAYCTLMDPFWDCISKWNSYCYMPMTALCVYQLTSVNEEYHCVRWVAHVFQLNGYLHVVLTKLKNIFMAACRSTYICTACAGIPLARIDYV